MEGVLESAQDIRDESAAPTVAARTPLARDDAQRQPIGGMPEKVGALQPRSVVDDENVLQLGGFEEDERGQEIEEPAPLAVAGAEGKHDRKTQLGPPRIATPCREKSAE